MFNEAECYNYQKSRPIMREGCEYIFYVLKYLRY
jgi:hypothetical protein